jgi:hypothetical protein
MDALEPRVGLERAQVAHGSVVDEPLALAAGQRRAKRGRARQAGPSLGLRRAVELRGD